MAFQARGERAQWKILYDELVRMVFGEIITDDEIATLLPDAAPGSVAGAMARAIKEIETNNSRSLERVRRVGYRMIEPTEHEPAARRIQGRAVKIVTRAHRKARSADRSRLDPDERRRVDALELNLLAQAEMLRRLQNKQEKTDARLARTEKDNSAINDRLDELESLLRRHGIVNDD